MKITGAAVAEYMRIPPDSHHDLIAGTVSQMVTRWHGEDWPEGVELGALMLASRLHRRRGTPNGVEGVSSDGLANYVSRWDPDLDRQLQLHDWLPPRVG